MGNNVCTDSVPTGYDELKNFARHSTAGSGGFGGGSSILSGPGGIASSSRSHRSESNSRSENASPLLKGGAGGAAVVPPEIRPLFTPYQHNLKCWSFGFDAATPAVGAIPVKLDANTTIDSKKSYLLLHLERVPVADQASNGAVGTGASQPWAVEALDCFTPRGLRESCSVDLMTMRWRHVPTDCTHKYGFSLFVLNGRDAETLVVATATARSYELEGILHKNITLPERLFFNEPTWKHTTEPLPIAAGIPLSGSGSRRSSGSGNNTSATTVSHGYLAEKVALYRRLHRLRPVIRKPQENVTKLGDLVEAPDRSTSNTSFSTNHNNYHRQLSAGSTQGSFAAGGSISPGGDQHHPHINYSEGGSSPDDRGASPENEDSRPKVPPMGIASSVVLQMKPLGVLTIPAAGLSTSPETARGGRGECTTTPPGLATIPLDIAGSNAFNHDETGNSDVIEGDRVRRLKESSPIATELVEYLRVGGEIPALDKRLLASLGITHVVNCGAIAIPSNHTDCFTYDSLFLGDSPDEEIAPFFPQIIESIERECLNDGKVYVHCHQGVSRSVSFCLAFLMWKRGQCYDEAFRWVKERRTVAGPNAGFYVTLLGFQSWLSNPLAEVRKWARLAAEKNNQTNSVEMLTKGGLVVYRYQCFRPDSHLFPLAFNLIYPPQKSTAQANQAFNQSSGAAVVHIDPRTCYLLLDLANPEAPKSTFIEGASCKGTHFASEARKAVDTLLRYGFYTLPTVTTSVTNKDSEVLEFRPKVFHESPVTEMEEDDSITGIFPTEDFGVEFTTEEGADFDDFASVAELENEIGLLVRARTNYRREGEQRASARQEVVAAPIAATPGPTPGRSLSNTLRDGGGAGGAEIMEALSDGCSEPEPVDELVDDGVAWDPLTILPFPDLSTPFEEFYDPSDLDQGTCYLVVNRKISGSSKPNVVYIWVGSNAEESEQDCLERYEDWIDAHDDGEDSAVATARRVSLAFARSEMIPSIEIEDEESDEFYRLVE